MSFDINIEECDIYFSSFFTIKLDNAIKYNAIQHNSFLYNTVTKNISDYVYKIQYYCIRVLSF